MESQDDLWKQKYLSSLDKLEKSEANWRALEDLLRLGMTRVALAAQGVDAELDRHLHDLRGSIRSGSGYQGLEAIVEDISTTVKKIDEGRRSQPIDNLNPAKLLIQLAQVIQLPKTYKKPLKLLLKQLHKDQSDNNITKCSAELAKMINQSLSIDDGAQVDDTLAKESGVWQRLFNRNAETKENTPNLQSTESVAEPATELASNVELTSHSPIATLSQSSIASGNENVDNALGEFCYQLLGALTFPADLMVKVNRLKRQVAGGVNAAEAIGVMHCIADLVTATRVQVEEEKEDLQAFLHQLSENLNEIDQHLAGAETQRQASIQSHKIMDEAVEAQVKNIQSSVQEAAELNQIKVVVSNKLDAIRDHLDTHRKQQQQHQLQLQKALNLSNARLREMETESNQLRELLQHEHTQAMHDVLTGISNRLAYEQRISEEYTRWKRYKKALSLLIFDVDHFKNINDTYGHKAGDKALKLIAKNLQLNLRESDFLARFGGEEFVVVMPETDIQAAIVVANKLREAVLAGQFHYQDKQVSITVSCGISHFNDGDNVESVFQRADDYLYKAKLNGRNQCHSEDT